MATNNKLAKARKHITTQRHGGGTSPPNLRRCRISPTKERRKSKTATKTNSVKVKNRKKQNCRPGGSGNLAGTPGGSFLFSTGAKVSYGRSMSRWTYLPNWLYSKLVLPAMILRVNRPKLRRHLEVPVQRGSWTLNENFVSKTNFAAVDAVRDRAASGRRAAGLEEGNFGDEDDLTEAVPRWGTGAVAAGSETGGKDRWNNSSRPTLSKINRASPN